MNNIDKSIFNSYETVETALLNDLATEVRTKGKKARTLKGEKYYVKYDGVWYDVTPEQCRIYKLIRNNYNMFVEHLNSAKSDILGFWKNVWGERLPVIIANNEKGIEICGKYFDAFKAFIIEGAKKEETEEKEDEETVETEEKEETTTAEATEEVSEHGSYKDTQNQERACRHPHHPLSDGRKNNRLNFQPIKYILSQLDEISRPKIRPSTYISDHDEINQRNFAPVKYILSQMDEISRLNFQPINLHF